MKHTQTVNARQLSRQSASQSQDGLATQRTASKPQLSSESMKEQFTGIHKRAMEGLQGGEGTREEKRKGRRREIWERGREAEGKRE